MRGRSQCREKNSANRETWRYPSNLWVSRRHRPLSDTSVTICSRGKPEQLTLDFINPIFFNHDKRECSKRVREALSIIFFFDSRSISTWICFKIMLLCGCSDQRFSDIIDDLNKWISLGSHAVKYIWLWLKYLFDK